MATFTVTTVADTVDAGDGVLSLREAVRQANATAAKDTILFAPALEGRTLTLSRGELAITQDVALDGDRNGDGTRVTLDGDDRFCVLLVAGSGGGGVDLETTDLDIVDGGFEDMFNFTFGSGITLLEGNTLTLRNCTVTGCSTYAAGGGLDLRAGTTTTIIDSSIVGNLSAAYGEDSPSYGGGISITSGTLEVIRSTIAGNRANLGGGGILAGDAALVDLEASTVANNSAAFGAGISGGSLRLSNSTVTDNFSYNRYAFLGSSDRGAGIEGDIAEISNSIVAGNVSGTTLGNYLYADDLLGRVVRSNGHNIFGSDVDGAIAGDREDVAGSRLFAATDPTTNGGILALNGGPTETAALRDALDNPALSGAEPVAAGDVDQRGFERPDPAGTNPDIGAFELAQTRISRTPGAGNDVLTGTAAADALRGRAGADLLLGLGGDDELIGAGDGDTLRGGPGNDSLLGGPGADTASYRDATGPVTVDLTTGFASGSLGSDFLDEVENLEGGPGADRLTGDGLGNWLGGRLGNDRLYGQGGDDRLFGQGGDDLLEGGFGNDRLDGSTGTDKVSYFNEGGPLAVTIDLARGVATRGGETDRLIDVEHADGTNNADLLQGDAGANALGGAGGADRVMGRAGNDTLLGAPGDDRLTGGSGRDVQTGGAGADVFDVDRLDDSGPGAGRDVITDFAPGADDLDLSTLDARTATPANDTFTFLAARGATFTAPGQVRWYQTGGNTFVEASTDADTAPELQIELAGLKTLSAADFVL